MASCRMDSHCHLNPCLVSSRDSVGPRFAKQLRILKAQGLISVDRGRGRGITIRRPGADTLSRSRGLIVPGDESKADLVESRKVLEPACAGIAATRHSAEDVAAMQQCDQKMDDCISQFESGRDMGKDLIQITTRWHMAVAGATGTLLSRTW